MTDDAENARVHRLLAALLWYGTLVASALIAIGMCLEGGQRISGSASVGAFGYNVVKAGIALLIALPATRVLLLFGVFLRRRDLAYILISGLVLIILGSGVLIGSSVH